MPSARLKNWDYGSDGAYFITICAQNRKYYFGDIENKKMQLSIIGRMAEKYWREIPQHFPFVILDAFIVMPNHIHGILFIQKMPFVETQNLASLQSQQPRNIIPPQHPQNWQPNKFGPQSKNIGSIIRGYKIGVTKFANTNEITFKWQPRFHDHIVRNEKELNRIREYIWLNPVSWENDRNNLMVKSQRN